MDVNGNILRIVFCEIADNFIIVYNVKFSCLHVELFINCDCNPSSSPSSYLNS